jgi:octaprenyl-diphosphate synthase
MQARPCRRFVQAIEPATLISSVSSISIATAAEVFDLLKGDLAAIEMEFARQSDSPVEVVTDIATYLMAGGGKRIRPLLLLLSAKALQCDSAARIRMGAVVEMLHTATLVHDDIIDEASTRRGRPSSNTTWGNAKCVLAGDWLYMQAFATALAERNFRVLDLLISLTQQMVEGELLQMEKLGHLINEEEYFDLIYRKTACLFKVSMQLGAVIANPESTAGQEPLDAPFEETLGEYGRNLGLAFQIVDDVLDLTANDDVLGKPAASDLREGKATLAVIHALERGTGADREAIRTVLADRSFARVAHAEILEILQRHGSIAYAMDTACAYAEAARQSITELPETDYKRALLWVPGYVTTRDR